MSFWSIQTDFIAIVDKRLVLRFLNNKVDQPTASPPQETMQVCLKTYVALALQWVPGKSHRDHFSHFPEYSICLCYFSAMFLVIFDLKLYNSSSHKGNFEKVYKRSHTNKLPIPSISFHTKKHKKPEASSFLEGVRPGSDHRSVESSDRLV